jgi:hypothetical protein
MCIMKYTEGDPVEQYLIYQCVRHINFAVKVQRSIKCLPTEVLKVRIVPILCIPNT